VLLAGILGGLIAFVWSSVVHMLPTGKMGLSVLNEKEDAVVAALKGSNAEDGLYFFPGMNMSKSMTAEQQAAWDAKYKAGPVGLLLYHPTGGDAMSPKQLLIELLATLLCGLIAAFVLASTVGSISSRAILVGLMGLFTWFAISVSQWNWYKFPLGFIAVDGLDQVIGWLLAGFLMAKMIKPAR
ncbi:MAG: hypothetical protein ABIP14_12865, partial [Blastocatellia bacterium]